MLRQMREWFRWLKWLLLIIIFMFIVWAAFVGGGSRSPANDQWAAKVNGTVIPTLTFQSYARQLDSTYQSLLGDQYAQQRSFIRIGQQAINQLIDEELLYQEAARQGIRVSAQEVGEAIRQDPSFQENGVFIGLARYRNLFRGGRMSLENYEAHVHRGLVIDKCRNLLSDGVSVTDAEVEQEFLRRNARTNVEYLLIDPAKVAAGKAPTDEEIAGYYEAHLDRYMQPEGRSGSYVLFSHEDLAAAQEVSDGDIQAAYERDRETRYSAPEQRRASHILFRVPAGASAEEVARIEAQAQSVLTRARADEDFAELAREYSEDSSSSLGGDLNFFGRGQMVKEFEEAAFTLPVGSISDLVRTTFGFHIIKVTDAREARTIPLDEVRDAIRDEIQMARARSEAIERSARFATTAAREGLESAAGSRGLIVKQTGTVRPGMALPDLPASNQVVSRMLSMSAGEVSEAIPVPSGQVVVQVDAVVPAEPEPLEQARDRVEKDFLDDRSRNAVADIIRGVAEQDGEIATLAERLGTVLKSQTDLTRGAPLPGVPRDPAIERQIATLSPGTIGEPIVTPSGLLVLSVRERSDHLEELESQRDSIHDSLVRQRQDRLIRSLLRRLRETNAVVINEPVVQVLDQG